MSRVPIPPADAERRNTVCQFCIVGCGYRVYKWPEGREGGAAPRDNALGLDLREPLPPNSQWIAPSMHRIITEGDGRRYHVAIVPDEECSVNHGLASVRGAGLAQTLYAPDQETKARLHVPMVLGPQGHERTSWDDAVDLGARLVKAVIDRWGPDAVGMKFFDHGGGGGGFENNWAVGRLFFSGIGTRTASIHNRPAYNSEVHAAADAGLAPLTNAYLDARLADTIVIAGANPYETQTNYFLDHMAPNLQGATLPGKRAAFGSEPADRARMIVIDPRRTMTVATAEAAGGADRVMHLDIEPGTDIALLNAISRVILDRRWHDVAFLRRHCEWQTFESWQRSTLQVGRPADEFVARAARLCGISPERIHEAARWIAAPKEGGYRRRTLLHYEKGLIWGLKNYENIAAIVGLGLISGNVGKPGTGISRLGGHQEAYVRPPYPGGRPALNVDEKVRRGETKVFWVGGCNPVLTTLRAEAMERALKRRGLLVTEALHATRDAAVGKRVTAVVEAMKRGGMFILAQDIYLTATARHATAALQAGCHVACEKPMAHSMQAARATSALAAESGLNYAVMQNRRYRQPIRAVRDIVASGALGELGIVNADFYLGPHFGGFRDAMESPLLLDMAIHTFDQARFITGRDPLAVYCHEFNPGWSWYAHGAAATAVFEMTGGLVFTYRGCWCSEALTTSWESAWRLVGGRGTLCWDGDGQPRTGADRRRGRRPRPPPTRDPKATRAVCRRCSPPSRPGARRRPATATTSRAWRWCSAPSRVPARGARVEIAELLP